MGRILKLVGIVVGALAVLFVGVLLLVGLFFDPNDYKDQIAAAVDDTTGRTLTLDGDLELHLFPRLRISAGAASLSNAPGFGDAPFARIESATLQVGILPLLSGRIDIDEARLRGLRLNLARAADGTNNWQDLSAAAGADDGAAVPADSEAAEEAPAGGSAAEINLGIGAIEIADAEVSWRDAATGTDWVLTGFNLEAEDLGPNATFPLSMEFAFTGPEIAVSVDSAMQATLSLADNTYELGNLDVTIKGEGAAWPGGSGGEARLRFDSFTANLDDQTLDLDGLRLQMLGLDVTGTLSGRNMFDDLTLLGGIEIHEFDPHDVLAAFDTEIETADDSVFHHASAEANFRYDKSQMAMNDLELALDDSNLTGSMGLYGEELRFDLAVDSIDIDRYLPPASEEQASSDEEGSIDEVDLPLDPLRSFVARGKLALDEAKFLGMTFTEANFALDARNGRLRLTPTGSLYGGEIEGEIGIALEGDSARFSLRQTLSNVDLAGLGKDFLKTDSLSGRGDVKLDVAATGTNVGAIRRDLDGTTSFKLSDGAYQGIDAWYELRRAWNVVRQNPTPERPAGPKQTTFSDISATGVVEDGVLTTDDLSATLPFMALSGSGTINLLTEELDLRTMARFVDGPVLQSDPAVAELAGLEIRLPIGGTVAEPAPAYASALGSLAADLVRRAANQRVEEEREEAREEVQQRVDEEREDLQDSLKDRLRRRLD